MADEISPNAAYELRRKARGTGAPAPPRPWWRRLLVPGVVILVVSSGAVGAWIRYSLTHVKTVRASVHAAVVNLSPDVDACLVKLCVSAGDRVAVGQELARLDDSQVKPMLEGAKAGSKICKSTYAQAQATLDLTRNRVEAEIELAAANVEAAAARAASAEAALVLRRARLTEEMKQAEALCRQAEARLSLLRKGPRSETIQAARARLATAQALEALYRLDVEQSQQLVGKGIDSRYMLEVKKTQLATQENRVEEARLDLARLEAGAGEDEIEVAVQAVAARQAGLALVETSAKELDTLAADVRVRRAELREARAELARAEADRTEIVLAEERVKAAAAELERAEADVQAREAALASMSIKSTVAGTVIRTFGLEGELLRKGVPCIRIVDDSRGRWVEGYVRERDAMKLHVGQEASVEFVVGSGVKVRATVEAVGLHTASLDGIGSAGASGTRGASAAELVWVKLRPEENDNSLLPGNSARAVIRLR